MKSLLYKHANLPPSSKTIITIAEIELGLREEQMAMQ